MSRSVKKYSANEKVRRRVRRHRSILRIRQSQNSEIRDQIENPSNITNFETSADATSALTKLNRWAIRNNIAHNAVSELLKILVSIGLTWLPMDARTFLKTPQQVQIENVANGNLWFLGIQNHLLRIFHNLNMNLKLELNFNIDGIPLFKCARKEFWPILANIHGIKNLCTFSLNNFIFYCISADFPMIKPFIVSIWYGSGKPSPVNDFLMPFVNELKELLANGVKINNFFIEIKVRCFICDTPARSLVKGIYLYAS